MKGKLKLTEQQMIPNVFGRIQVRVVRRKGLPASCIFPLPKCSCLFLYVCSNYHTFLCFLLPLYATYLIKVSLQSLIFNICSLKCQINIYLMALFFLSGEDTKLFPLTENHDGRTLAELPFIDGDSILVESIKCEQMQVKEVSFVKIFVKNFCNVSIKFNFLL